VISDKTLRFYLSLITYHFLLVTCHGFSVIGL
jgi:hypothetical protein